MGRVGGPGCWGGRRTPAHGGSLCHEDQRLTCAVLPCCKVLGLGLSLGEPWNLYLYPVEGRVGSDCVCGAAGQGPACTLVASYLCRRQARAAGHSITQPCKLMLNIASMCEAARVTDWLIFTVSCMALQNSHSGRCVSLCSSECATTAAEGEAHAAMAL